MKIKWSLFWEIFISFLIVIILTLISFNAEYLRFNFEGLNIFLFILKLFFIAIVAFILTYFICNNLSQTYYLLKKSIDKLKKSNLRDRVVIDRDYIFHDLLDDLNDFRDIIDSKLKIIKENITYIKNNISEDEYRKIKDQIEEIEEMYEDRNQ
ncbi:MAG TPA: hypothetical protein VKN74_08010 [Candidatus Mcinerneyibacterium sp.]|nr:hypothetical protein [Candidatus Mcinerneyibacterium sp.]